MGRNWLRQRNSGREDPRQHRGQGASRTTIILSGYFQINQKAARRLLGLAERVSFDRLV
jgi:hypothetical protein